MKEGYVISAISSNVGEAYTNFIFVSNLPPPYFTGKIKYAKIFSSTEEAKQYFSENNKILIDSLKDYRSYESNLSIRKVSWHESFKKREATKKKTKIREKTLEKLRDLSW